MTNLILHNDGSVSYETLHVGGLYGYPSRYSKKQLETENDWFMTRGRDGLSMCGVPVNGFVIGTLLQLVGSDVQMKFNFADKDCPEYSEYIRMMEEHSRYREYREQLKVVERYESASRGVPTEELEKLRDLSDRAYQYDPIISEDAEGYEDSRLKHLKRHVDDMGKLHFHIDVVDDAVNLLIMYAFYRSLLSLPYEDSAADSLPTIEEVYVDGTVSTIFDELLSYINKAMFAFDEFGIPHDSPYMIIIHKKKPRWRILYGELPKEIKDKYHLAYVSIGGGLTPLYIRLTRKEYKRACQIKMIDCSISVYDREQYKKARHDGTEPISIGDDFLHSGSSGVSDVLYFAVAFPYLISILVGKQFQHDRDVVLGYEYTMYAKTKNGLKPYTTVMAYDHRMTGHHIMGRVLDRWRTMDL